MLSRFYTNNTGEKFNGKHDTSPKRFVGKASNCADAVQRGDQAVCGWGEHLETLEIRITAEKKEFMEIGGVSRSTYKDYGKDKLDNAKRILEEAETNYETVLDKFLAVILRTFISIVITLVFSLLPIIGTVIGIVVAFLVNGGITAGIFSSSYGKGLLTEIIFMFIGFCLVVAVVVVGFAATGGALLSL